jgi:hypothetical protein
MIPLLVSGIFVVGLMLVDTLRKPTEPWNSREEYQKFQQSLEQWRNGGWMLYR